MSKKNYEAIAALLRRQHVRSNRSTDAIAALDVLREDMADYMAEDNPRFDRGRFLAACRGEDYEVRGYDSKSGTIQTKRTVRYGS
jgi:hypothetical protein